MQVLDTSGEGLVAGVEKSLLKFLHFPNFCLRFEAKIKLCRVDQFAKLASYSDHESVVHHHHCQFVKITSQKLSNLKRAEKQIFV